MTHNDTPPIDVGNPFALSAPWPANLSVTRVQGEQGQRLVLTLRSAGATLSVQLDKRGARAWWELIKSEEEQMTNLIVPALKPPNGRGSEQ